jgi:hypothetical protein
MATLYKVELDITSDFVAYSEEDVKKIMSQ